MAKTASSTALALPELVISVLRYLDRLSLVEAIRVNNLWFEAGVPFLWNDFDHTGNLMRIDGKQRRQFYANQLLNLTFSDGSSLHEQFGAIKDLQFPKLCTMDLREEDLLRGQQVARFLTPTLTRLWFDGTTLHDDDLIAMAPHMGHIKWLCMDTLGNDVTPHSLRRLIEGCVAVERLEIEGGPWGRPGADLAVWCAALHQLRRLSNPTCITVGLARRIAEVVPAPFPALEFLASKVEADALPQLLSALSADSIRGLYLRIPSGPQRVCLGGFARLQRLEKLVVFLGDSSRITAEQLGLLASSPRLESLTVLRNTNGGGPPAEGEHILTDESLVRVMAQVPLLKSLTISYRLVLTVGCLPGLVRACPRLEILNLGPFNVTMQQVETMQAAPLGESALRTLTVGDFVQPEGLTEEEAM